MEILKIAFVALLCMPILYIGFIMFSKLIDEYLNKAK